MASVEELGAFAIPGVARFVDRNGLTALEVTHAAAHGVAYLHGGHVASYTPAGQRDVLWMSGKSWFAANKPLRGGVPVCFPWFGPKADNPALPGHGTVRLREWQVESLTQSSAGVSVTLATKSTAADLAAYPHAFELRHRIVFGAALRMELEIINTNAAAAKYEEALHTYFTVGDVRNIRIDGLGGLEYLDKVGGVTRRRQDGPITITAETDRVYLDTTHTVTIADPGMARRIVIEKTGSRSTVVWNPWVAKSRAMADFGDEEWPGMMCVETANVADAAVTLAPGGKHVMAAVIRVETL